MHPHTYVSRGSASVYSPRLLLWRRTRQRRHQSLCGKEKISILLFIIHSYGRIFDSIMQNTKINILVALFWLSSFYLASFFILSVSESIIDCNLPPSQLAFLLIDRLTSNRTVTLKDPSVCSSERNSSRLFFACLLQLDNKIAISFGTNPRSPLVYSRSVR